MKTEVLVRGWKIATGVLLAACLVSNALWAYLTIDTAVSQMYAESVAFDVAHRCDALKRLALPRVQGMSVDVATRTLRALDAGDVFVNDGAVHGARLAFTLNARGTVSAIDADCQLERFTP